MKKAKVSSLVLSALFMSAIHQSASASTVTLEANAGRLSSGITYDFITLSGSSFSLSGSDRGGAGYAYITGVPVGSEYDFKTDFTGAMGESVTGTLNTPETGSATAL